MTRDDGFVLKEIFVNLTETVGCVHSFLFTNKGILDTIMAVEEMKLQAVINVVLRTFSIFFLSLINYGVVSAGCIFF